MGRRGKLVTGAAKDIGVGMSQNIYTKALERAVELEGSTQAIAHLLRVPESTLQRWMAGRAQMPLQAFLKLIDFVVRHEEQIDNGMRTDIAPRGMHISAEGIVTLKAGPVTATCERCDGTQFALAEPDKPLRYVSDLVCRSCDQRVIHGKLVSQLAKDVVHQSRAFTATRRRLLEERTQRAAPRAPDKKRLLDD